jgi:hypothetical protein
MSGNLGRQFEDRKPIPEDTSGENGHRGGARQGAASLRRTPAGCATFAINAKHVAAALSNAHIGTSAVQFRIPTVSGLPGINLPRSKLILMSALLHL